MVRVYQAKSCLDEIVSKNNAAIRDLRSSISQVQADRKPVDEKLDQILQTFVMGLFEPLDRTRLTQLSTLVGAKQGYLEDFQAQLTASERSAQKLAELQARHGSLASLEALCQTQNQAVQQQAKVAGALERTVKTAQEDLAPVQAFNKQAAGDKLPKLDAEGMPYFTSRKGLSHIFNYCCNSHYRHGRGLINTLAKAGQPSIPAYTQKLQSDQTVLKSQQNALATERQELARTQEKLAAVKQAAKGTLSESAITHQMVSNICVTLSNQKNFDAVAKGMESFPAYAVELRAKQNAFKQVQERAEQSVQSLSKASEKLERPLSKLRTAERRNRHADIRMDLDSIRRPYEQAQKGATTLADKTRKASKSVKDYKTTQQDTSNTSTPPVYTRADYIDIAPTDFLMIWMIHDMMASSVTRDVAGMVATPDQIQTLKTDAIDFGALESVPDAAGLQDIPAATPDIDFTPDMPDIPDMNVPDFNVPDVPDMNIPDVDIPDISIPDVPDFDISIPDVDISLPDIDIGGIDF